MRHSLRTGFSFGLTSGIITTLGLMVGLHSGTNSKLAIIGGVVVIAVADAFSDAMGMHISEEVKNEPARGVWESTFWTFFSKFIVALTFVVPIIFLDMLPAIIVSVAWGLLLLGIFSYRMAKANESDVWKVVGEHILIAVVVIIITHYVGDLVSAFFG